MKKAWLQLGAFVSSIAPLGITLGVNWDKYAPTEYEGIKLGIGASIICVFVLLKALNKINAPKGIWLFGIIFAISWLMKSVVDDVVLLSGMALVGELCDCGFQIAITKVDVKDGMKKSALINAQAMKEVLNE